VVKVVIDRARSGQLYVRIPKVTALAARQNDKRSDARDAQLRGLVRAHHDAVWRTLRRLTSTEGGVDDAAQQVWLVAARRLDEIRAGGERAYLMGIAVKVASDARRALRRRREREVPMDPDQTVASTANGPEEVFEQKRRVALLDATLRDIPDDLREAFVLFELEELSAPEVADVLRIPLGTVASRVRRAREQIRLRLTGKDGGK
jgi:RNA polymerase sigma-70 factor (ECF subfamily)